MRSSRRAAVLEHILDAASLEELFTGSQRDRADTHRVLADVARGGSGASQRTVAAVARVRGVTPQYIVDRVMVFVARMMEAHRCDPYQVLGVQRTASTQDIQRRWRQLAKRFHPDVGVDPEGAAVFRRLQDAYEILRDPERRIRFEARQLRDGELVAWSAAAAPPGAAALGVAWVQEHLVEFVRRLASLGLATPGAWIRRSGQGLRDLKLALRGVLSWMLEWYGRWTIVPAGIRRLGVVAVVTVVGGWVVAQAYWVSKGAEEPSRPFGRRPTGHLALLLDQPELVEDFLCVQAEDPVFVQTEDPEITEQASAWAPGLNSEPENAQSGTSHRVGLVAAEERRIVEDSGPTQVPPNPGAGEPASWSTKTYPGSGDSPGGASPVQGPVTRDEAAHFVETYRQHYERRRVSALVELFADDAVENARIGRHAIGAAYQAALGSLGGVSYELGGLEFKQLGEGIRVESPFTIVYARSKGTQMVKGVAAWNIVRQGGALKIARLTYEIDR